MNPILADLHRIASEETTPARFFSALRACLIRKEAGLTRLAGDVKPGDLIAVYLANKLVNDLYFNLCIDTSFGFPQDHPRIRAMHLHLRRFLRGMLNGEGSLHDAAAAVADYFACIADLDAQLLVLTHGEIQAAYGGGG